jgi:hypothetical protein
MRVQIPIPPGWRTHSVLGGWTSGAGTGESLVASRLEPLPALAVGAWAARRLRADVPLGCELTIDAAHDGQSARGWPVTVFSCRLRAAGGRIAQHRAVALYRFVSWAGTAELRADRPLTPAHEPLVRRILEATPDFTGEVACLADVLAGVELG